ncbi:MAG TPA: RagB/SusD family nutrient uptake outer membrane protein [Candidatus Bacteroides intestinigallinarum]|nr:RagB/SusD family nutrient uptake outer membrane protein [Candidatus Bacteroides intestinigallinarum]
MKTKINHILPVLLLVAVSGLTTVSCNDFLDKTPDNRTELNTDQKIAKLLVSAYPDVSPNELFELYSDNSDDSGPTYGYYQLSEKECYNWEDTKEEYQDTPNSLWGGYYGAISAANMALKAIEEKGNPASLNPQRGEALVCRAYCHFMLATIFCNAYDTHASESLGIPYMEDVETTVSPRYERGTLEEVYRKVERDLLEGVELISDDGYSVPKYHFTRKAAYAFAARFYLYYMKPDFSNCDRVIEFATRVLGSNPDDLLRDWEALSNLSVNGNVQADAYIASSNEANLLISSTVSNWGALGSDYLVGPRYFHNQTLATNETCLSAGLWGSSDYLYLKPFSTTGFVASILRKSGLYDGGYLYYMPVLFSTDETLLCRAEAYALKKMYAQSAADITSWQRAYTRNKSALTPDQINAYYDKMNFYTPFTQQTPKKQLAPDFTIEEGMQENILHCILHIRRVTTLHEGMRWPDIKRYGIMIYRRDMTTQHVTDEMPPNDLRRAIQIPRNVIVAGMQPNPRRN